MNKKIISSIIVALALFGLGIVVFLFTNKTDNANNSVISNVIDQVTKNEKPYSNRFADFNSEELSPSNRESLPFPQDLSTVTNNEKVPQNEDATKLLTKNGFVLTPKAEANPFSLYEQNNNENIRSLITDDIVLLSYVSFFKEIENETLNGPLHAELVSFLETLAQREKIDSRLAEIANTALQISNKTTENTNEKIQAELTLINEAQQKNQSTILDTEIDYTVFANLTPEQKSWKWLSYVNFGNTSTEITSLASVLSSDEELKKTYLSIYDTLVFFSGRETKPDAYSILEEKPENTIEENIFLFPQTNIIQTQLDLLITPNIPERKQNKDLDVPAIANNIESQSILDSEGDSKVYPGFTQNLEEIQNSNKKQSAAFITHSLATHLLYINSLATPTSGAAYLQTEGYQKKHLNTLLGINTVYLQEPTSNTAANTGVGESETASIYIEPHFELYAHLAGISMQIMDGLEKRNLITTRQQEKLLDAQLLAKDLLNISEKEMSDTTISNDIISRLAALYSNMFGQAALHLVSSNDEEITYNAIGKGFNMHAIITINGVYEIARGFALSQFSTKEASQITQSEWETRVREGNMPAYALWNRDFIAAESQ